MYGYIICKTTCYFLSGFLWNILNGMLHPFGSLESVLGGRLLPCQGSSRAGAEGGLGMSPQLLFSMLLFLGGN